MRQNMRHPGSLNEKSLERNHRIVIISQMLGVKQGHHSIKMETTYVFRNTGLVKIKASSSMAK